MNDVVLPALDGREPLGFLAAVGLTRLLTVHANQPAKLAWSPTDCTASLRSDAGTTEALAEMVLAVVDAIPPDGVLPGCPVDFPPLGAAPDGLRLDRRGLREYSNRFPPGGEAEKWISSLVTDLSLDDSSRSDISLMTAPAGKQSMRTMLEKPLSQIRENRGVVTEALIGWRRYAGVTGEYLDHRVLYDAADSSQGKAQERGVPGATWLALMSYPLLRTTALRNAPLTSGWSRRPRKAARFSYPLWRPFLDIRAIGSLLTHPVLGFLPDDREANDSLRALQVFRVQHAQRRRIPGRTFAGVLAPMS